MTDAMLYEMQRDDPTKDEMMVFMKEKSDSDIVADEVSNQTFRIPENLPLTGKKSAEAPCNSNTGSANLDSSNISSSSGISSLMENIPNVLLSFGQIFVDKLLDLLQSSEQVTSLLMQNRTPGQKLIVNQFIKSLVEPLTSLLKGLKPNIQHVKFKTVASIIPRELYILINALIDKAKRGDASANELIAVSLIMDIQTFVTSMSNKKEVKKTDLTKNVSTKRDVSSPEQVQLKDRMTRMFDRLLIALPAISQPNRFELAGFSSKAQSLIESKIGKDQVITGEVLSKAVYPYVNDAV